MRSKSCSRLSPCSSKIAFCSPPSSCKVPVSLPVAIGGLDGSRGAPPCRGAARILRPGRLHSLLVKSWKRQSPAWTTTRDAGYVWILAIANTCSLSSVLDMGHVSASLACWATPGRSPGNWSCFWVRCFFCPAVLRGICVDRVGPSRCLMHELLHAIHQTPAQLSGPLLSPSGQGYSGL
eukprot:4037822-Amphidinium_carterae.1